MANSARLQRILVSLSQTQATMRNAFNIMLGRGLDLDDMDARADDLMMSSEQFLISTSPWHRRCWLGIRRWWRINAPVTWNPVYWVFRCCRSVHRYGAKTSDDK